MSTASLKDMNKQDFLNLMSVLDLDRSTEAPYFLDGVVYSPFQRKETVYRLQVHGKVYKFIFDREGHLRASSEGDTSYKKGTNLLYTAEGQSVRVHRPPSPVSVAVRRILHL